MNARAGAHGAVAQTIDRSIVRAHQHAAYITRNRRPSVRRSRGRFTGEIHDDLDTGESRSDAAAASRLRAEFLAAMTTVLGILAPPFDVFWMGSRSDRGGGFRDPNRLYDDRGAGSLYHFLSKRVDTPRRSAAGLVISIVSTRCARPQRAVSICMAERVDRRRRTRHGKRLAARLRCDPSEPSEGGLIDTRALLL